jgi:two-component system, NtrC family, sensor kinase
VIGMGSDVTEQVVLEAQLQQAQKLESIGQLAAGVAHEINTPTQFVGDNLRFLKDALGEVVPALAAAASAAGAGKGDDLAYLRDEIPRAIDQSLEGISRVATIVQAMKAFSHPDLGEKSLVDLNAAITTTLTVARNEYKYVATVETDLDPALPMVDCIPGEINQTILNLVVNAAHAIAERGERAPGLIRIVTRGDGEAVEIRISDTGAGIPVALRPRLFSPFFTTKPVGKGTGQGLFIAHNVIVRRHGGSIACDSEVGRGTVFTIRLPLRAPATAGA